MVVFKDMGSLKPVIKTQKDVKDLEHYDPGAGKSVMLKVQGVRRLFVRIQKSTSRLSISYVFRYSERTPETGAGNSGRRSRARYKSLGIVSEISLREARKQAGKLNRQILLRGLTVFSGENKEESALGDPAPGITLRELFELYVQNHNLKESSLKSYRSVICGFSGQFADTPVAEINPEDLDLSLHHNTRKYYICILNSIAAWGVKRGTLSHNPFLGLYQTCERVPARHRYALSCHNFDSLEIAAEKVREFLTALALECPETVFLTWICHLILGTRISETCRVIMNAESMKLIPGTESYVMAIEVKSTRRGDSAGFRIPVIPLLRRLILRIRPFYQDMKPDYFPKFLRRSIPGSFRERMSLHGSRSVFRTVIELMNPRDISGAARELYLSHDIRNAVQQAYSRGDYLADRLKLQQLYGDWLLSLLSEKTLGMLLSAPASVPAVTDNSPT